MLPKEAPRRASPGSISVMFSPAARNRRAAASPTIPPPITREDRAVPRAALPAASPSEGKYRIQLPSCHPQRLSMPRAPRISWRGVFPPHPTQFAPDMSIDFDATRSVQDALIRDGVHGMVVMGTVGENNSLESEEKRAVLRTAVECSHGRIPVITGVSEMTTPRAVAY